MELRLSGQIQMTSDRAITCRSCPPTVRRRPRRSSSSCSRAAPRSCRRRGNGGGSPRTSEASIFATGSGAPAASCTPSFVHSASGRATVISRTARQPPVRIGDALDRSSPWRRGRSAPRGPSVRPSSQPAALQVVRHRAEHVGFRRPDVDAAVGVEVHGVPQEARRHELRLAHRAGPRALQAVGAGRGRDRRSSSASKQLGAEQRRRRGRRRASRAPRSSGRCR